VGKCSLTGQLSTCKVALPPFLVKRTRWYLPSFIAVVVSFTLMSTVPMLNVTHTLPCSWNTKGRRGSYSGVTWGPMNRGHMGTNEQGHMGTYEQGSHGDP